MSFKLNLTVDVLYTVESQGPTHYWWYVRNVRLLGLSRLKLRQDAVRPSAFSSRGARGTLYSLGIEPQPFFSLLAEYQSCLYQRPFWSYFLDIPIVE